MIPIFANSYFLELSLEKNDISVEFVKFNSFRKKEYRMFTYCMNDNYYKKSYNEDSKSFLNNYKNSSIMLKEYKFRSIDILEDEKGVYTEECLKPSLLDVILKKSYDDNYILEYLEKYRDYLYSHYNKIKAVEKSETAFEKFDIDINKDAKTNLTFISEGFIDIIPQNIIVSYDDYYLIDQEWTMKNIPLEFILYRGILSTVINCYKKYDRDTVIKYMDKFGIACYIELFEKLEDAFQNSVLNDSYDTMRLYFDNNGSSKIISEEEYNQNKKIISENESLIAENLKLNSDINNIINSKRWKLMNKILKIFGK